ncbi:hypothetical protein [Hafnia paralvei]|uniref:hypothetical protein n=1 Tax=Hafnia paralvei TaxID=546367 RepID=UPI00210D1405|nr:hypothetical protein [Hafnia paralvei]MCQ4171664.1 hypothetical protein [Hafnia paralvei]
MTSREQFEAAWEKNNEFEPMDGWESLRCDDGYTDEIIDGQWWAWQASREAVAVAVDKIDGSRLAHVYLESTTTDKVDAYVKGWNACIDSINVK